MAIYSSGRSGPTYTAMAFVDGENLVCRYQEMIAGRKLNPRVDHIQDVFAWHPNMGTTGNLSRVNYYASAVGDDAKIESIRDEIGKCHVDTFMGGTRLAAHVFKKPANTKKSKLVDISLTIDALRHTHANDVNRIIIYSGDADYVPLVQEIMRAGKQVVVGALSSGLSPELRRIADQFTDLDQWFFYPA